MLCLMLIAYMLMQSHNCTWNNWMNEIMINYIWFNIRLSVVSLSISSHFQSHRQYSDWYHDIYHDCKLTVRLHYYSHLQVLSNMRAMLTGSKNKHCKLIIQRNFLFLYHFADHLVNNKIRLLSKVVLLCHAFSKKEGCSHGCAAVAGFKEIAKLLRLSESHNL